MKLVSAIMPTRGRTALALRAVECFLAQTYFAAELLILDDIEDPSFPDGLPPGHRILRWLSASRSIPEKRNLLCRLAKGDYIAHFDSDDWSAPRRLEEQMKLIEDSDKKVTGYSTVLFYDGAKLYRYHNGPHYAVGTSLVYRRDWWQQHPFKEDLPFEEGPRKGELKPWGEDNVFVREALNHDAFISVEGEGIIVAGIHAENTATKHVEGWQYQALSLDALPEGFPRW